MYWKIIIIIIIINEFHRDPSLTKTSGLLKKGAIRSKLLLTLTGKMYSPHHHPQKPPLLVSRARALHGTEAH